MRTLGSKFLALFKPKERSGSGRLIAMPPPDCSDEELDRWVNSVGEDGLPSAHAIDADEPKFDPKALPAKTLHDMEKEAVRRVMRRTDPFFGLRDLGSTGETELEVVLDEFPWAKQYKFAVHRVHIPHVAFVLRELESTLGLGKLSQILDFRFATNLQFSKGEPSSIVLNYTYLLADGSNLQHVVQSLCDPMTDASKIAFACGRAMPEEAARTLLSTPLGRALSKEIDQQAGDADGAVGNPGQPDPTTPSVQVLPKNAADIVKQLTDATRDKTDSGRLSSLEKKLRAAELSKPLTLVVPDLCERIGTNRFPNFGEFTNFLQSQFALAAVSDGAIRMQPVLLLGEPGIGKTEYLLRLATVLGMDFLKIDMGSATTGDAIAGMEQVWYGSRPGQLFTTLAFGKAANPIVFLDEMDKVNHDQKFSPVGALYTLLERRTAAEFEDAYLPGLKIDASHVIWVAAANDKRAIDPAILSRLRVFEIPSPTRAQMPTITQSVYQNMVEREKWGSKFTKELEPDVLEAFAASPARLVRQMLEAAVASAAMDGRTAVRVGDIKSIVKTSNMGFTATALGAERQMSAGLM